VTNSFILNAFVTDEDRVFYVEIEKVKEPVIFNSGVAKLYLVVQMPAGTGSVSFRVSVISDTGPIPLKQQDVTSSSAVEDLASVTLVLEPESGNFDDGSYQATLTVNGSKIALLNWSVGKVLTATSQSTPATTFNATALPTEAITQVTKTFTPVPPTPVPPTPVPGDQGQSAGPELVAGVWRGTAVTRTGRTLFELGFTISADGKSLTKPTISTQGSQSAYQTTIPIVNGEFEEMNIVLNPPVVSTQTFVTIYGRFVASDRAEGAFSSFSGDNVRGTWTAKPVTN